MASSEPIAGGRRGEVILKVEGLVKHFPITRGVVFQKQIGAV